MDDTFATEEASSTSVLVQEEASEGPSALEVLAERVNGSKRGTEFISREDLQKATVLSVRAVRSNVRGTQPGLTRAAKKRPNQTKNIRHRTQATSCVGDYSDGQIEEGREVQLQ